MAAKGPRHFEHFPSCLLYNRADDSYWVNNATLTILSLMDGTVPPCPC
jgi:hypothetical protein